MYRARLTFTKSKESIYISEKDLDKVFETALVRAKADLYYTKTGKTSIVFADNLHMGVQSTCEICDVTLNEYLDPSFLIKAINQELPTGMVVLKIDYLNDDEKSIDVACKSLTYEIYPNLGDVTKMTNREYEDKRRWYRFQMEEYLSASKILVLVKHLDRSERIDIKEAIIDYEILINDALKITISKNTEYLFNPNYIMDGFKEYINQNMEYSIKRTKISF